MEHPHVRIHIQAYPHWKQLLDRTMAPLMYLAMGTLNERPRETHFWNSRTLSTLERWRLNHEYLVTGQGFYTTSNDKLRTYLARIWPFFHAPMLGGLNQYLVLMVEGDTEVWHVGWVTPDRSWGEVRQLPIFDRKVRVLLKPEPMCYFAVAASGTQLPLTTAGRGRLGDAQNAYMRLF